MAGDMILFKSCKFSGLLLSKAISRNLRRFKAPSACKTSSPKRDASTLSSGEPTSTTSRATISASTIGTFNFLNKEQILLLPQAMPPVSPTTKGLFSVLGIKILFKS